MFFTGLTLGLFFLFFLLLSGLKPARKNKTLVPTPTLTPNNTFQRPYPSPTSNPPTPTASSLSGQNTASREQIISQMPVATPEYNIEYLQTSDMFIVTIKKSPYEQNKALAEGWFKSRGVFDMSSFNIKFTKYNFVQ